jgi:hypothetical protein
MRAHLILHLKGKTGLPGGNDEHFEVTKEALAPTTEGESVPQIIAALDPPAPPPETRPVVQAVAPVPAADPPPPTLLERIVSPGVIELIEIPIRDYRALVTELVNAQAENTRLKKALSPFKDLYGPGIQVGPARLMMWTDEISKIYPGPNGTKPQVPDPPSPLAATSSQAPETVAPGSSPAPVQVKGPEQAASRPPGSKRPTWLFFLLAAAGFIGGAVLLLYSMGVISF